MKIITQQLLDDLFLYDEQAGDLIWRARPPETFATKRAASMWNTKFAWKVAGCLKFTGYRHISLDGKYYQAHRLIWLMVNGEIPSEHIDHIDGNKSNNRISNLRSVSGSENSKNLPRQVNNTSGCVGISWNKACGKWYAYIKTAGKLRNLGFYTEKDDAIAARKSAERVLGFHENHGRVA